MISLHSSLILAIPCFVRIYKYRAVLLDERVGIVAARFELLQTTVEHSPLEFEEFQTNPITHDVQDATTAETEREVQRICIVNSLGIFSARVPEFSCERERGATSPLRVLRTCAHLCLHMRSICTVQARVCRANTVYSVSRATDSLSNSVPPTRRRSNESIRSEKLSRIFFQKQFC